MKIQPRDINHFLQSDLKNQKIIFLFGPEEGLVAERGLKLAQKISPDLQDAFSVVNLTPQSCAEQPSLIHDEMASRSLMGTEKLIRIRQANDKIFQSLDLFIKAELETDNFLLIEAGDLDKRSKLRNLAEKSNKIAAIACYEEDASRLIPYIQQRFSEEGYTSSQDVLIALSTALSSNRLLLNSEIDKLIAYKGNEKEITLDDVKQNLSKHDDAFYDEPAWAAANGHYQQTDTLLTQLLKQSIAPVSILRAAQNHFNKLLIVKEEMAVNIPLEKALFSIRPPLFFKTKPIFVKQLQNWNIKAIKDVIFLLQTAEKECKMGQLNPDTLLSRNFYKICAKAEQKSNPQKLA